MNTIQILQTRIERFESAISQLNELRIALCDDRDCNTVTIVKCKKDIPIAGIARNKLIQGIDSDITDLEIQVDTLKLNIQKLQDNEQEIPTH